MQSFCLIVCVSNSLINHWRTDQIKYPLHIYGNMMIVNEIGTVIRLACRDQIFSIELWERYIYRWTFLQYLLLFVSCSIVCGLGALCSAASAKSTYCALSICLLGEIHSGKRAAFLSALPPEECFWRVPRLQNGGWPMAPASSVPRRRIFPRICRQNSTHFITPISTDRRKKNAANFSDSLRHLLYASVSAICLVSFNRLALSEPSRGMQARYNSRAPSLSPPPKYFLPPTSKCPPPRPDRRA